MPLVPPNIETLKPYKAGKPIDEVKRELGLKRVVKLASNENPLGPSPLAIEEMKKSFAELHLYPNAGYDLRVQLAGMYNVKLENVITGSGSEGIMLNIMRTFICPEDEVLTTDAAFIGFQVLAHAQGVAYRTVPYRNWHYDLPAIAEQINKRTKLIYLANPNNPTGTRFTRQEFDIFYRQVPQNVLIVFDEAYFEYAINDPYYPDSMKYRYDNVITLRTFSKVYGLAGIRIGYGFAHEDLIANLLKVKLPFEPSTLAQAAAIGALKDTGFLSRTLEVNSRGLRFMTNALRELELEFVPSSANFIMVVCASGDDVDFIFQEMLKQGVIIRPLKPFGLPNCLRISIGTDEENAFCIDRLKNVLTKVSR
jgi:histidinol-phosphate aminotransferase